MLDEKVQGESPDPSGLKDVTYQPYGPWGSTYKGKGHYVSGASGQCRFEVVGPLAPTRSGSWVWAIQRKLERKHD